MKKTICDVCILQKREPPNDGVAELDFKLSNMTGRKADLCEDHAAEIKKIINSYIGEGVAPEA